MRVAITGGTGRIGPAIAHRLVGGDEELLLEAEVVATLDRIFSELIGTSL
jgi:nucleoside-diphosphate-sugar epimerase